MLGISQYAGTGCCHRALLGLWVAGWDQSLYSLASAEHML